MNHRSEVNMEAREASLGPVPEKENGTRKVMNGDNLL